MEVSATLLLLWGAGSLSLNWIIFLVCRQVLPTIFVSFGRLPKENQTRDAFKIAEGLFTSLVVPFAYTSTTELRQDLGSSPLAASLICVGIGWFVYTISAWIVFRTSIHPLNSEMVSVSSSLLFFIVAALAWEDLAYYAVARLLQGITTLLGHVNFVMCDCNHDMQKWWFRSFAVRLVLWVIFRFSYDIYLLFHLYGSRAILFPTFSTINVALYIYAAASMCLMWYTNVGGFATMCVVLQRQIARKNMLMDRVANRTTARV